MVFAQKNKFVCFANFTQVFPDCTDENDNGRGFQIRFIFKKVHKSMRLLAAVNWKQVSLGLVVL